MGTNASVICQGQRNIPSLCHRDGRDPRSHTTIQMANAQFQVQDKMHCFFQNLQGCIVSNFFGEWAKSEGEGSAIFSSCCSWCYIVALQPFLLLPPTVEGALGSAGFSQSLLPCPSSAPSQPSPSSFPPPLTFPIPVSPQRLPVQQQGVR